MVEVTECSRPRCADPVRWGGMCAHHYRKVQERGLRRRVDAQPVIEHVRALEALGWRRNALSRRLGLHRATVHKMSTGDYDTVRQAVYATVLAVPLKPPPPSRVHRIGFARRAQALACLGWTFKQLEARAGWHPGRIWSAMLPGRNGGEYIPREWHLEMCALYDQLSMTKPVPGVDDHGRTINQRKSAALRNGWVPPLDWDDDEIDNPEAKPFGSPLLIARKEERRQHDYDRYHHGIKRLVDGAPTRKHLRQLRDCGWSNAEIVERADIPRETIRNILYRSTQVNREAAARILALDPWQLEVGA
ncbi:hypothetical protein [Saccharopolyspora mangrovi]|uniref:Uncharacterized protein n=1 Tax=Saccharopolyspora mangrovi TaxID=3082379 RepID=A0ABU6A790_9PSEU|nr:hypothetical protein [Saccharopolyspora sp. S2-29]MEB3367393.1 hypothetical protein [Saccharopolyspora sp. S2-29]